MFTQSFHSREKSFFLTTIIGIVLSYTKGLNSQNNMRKSCQVTRLVLQFYVHNQLRLFLILGTFA